MLTEMGLIFYHSPSTLAPTLSMSPLLGDEAPYILEGEIAGDIPLRVEQSYTFYAANWEDLGNLMTVAP